MKQKTIRVEDDSYAKRDPVCSVGVQHFKVHTAEGIFDGEHYNDGNSPNRVCDMWLQGKLNTKHYREEK